jgi:hypothetical protein
VGRKEARPKIQCLYTRFFQAFVCIVCVSLARTHSPTSRISSVWKERDVRRAAIGRAADKTTLSPSTVRAGSAGEREQQF